MTENLAQDVELSYQMTGKKPRQNWFFWIFYCVFGVLIMAGAVNGIVSTIVMKEPFAIGSFAIPVLCFLPVFLVKFYRRFATLWALMLAAILWVFYSLVMIMYFYVLSVYEIKHFGGESAILFVLLDLFIITVFITPSLLILTISGMRSLIRCIKEDEPVAVETASEQETICGVESQIQRSTKKPGLGLFFWNLYFAYGLILTTSKILQWEMNQLVYLLWFVPLLLVKFNRRIATVSALIPISALLVVFFFTVKLQYQILVNVGEGFDRWYATEYFGRRAAWQLAFYLIPLSILLVAWIWAVIRYFKEAKSSAAVVNFEKQEDEAKE